VGSHVQESSIGQVNYGIRCLEGGLTHCEGSQLWKKQLILPKSMIVFVVSSKPLRICGRSLEQNFLICGDNPGIDKSALLVKRTASVYSETPTSFTCFVQEGALS